MGGSVILYLIAGSIIAALGALTGIYIVKAWKHRATTMQTSI